MATHILNSNVLALRRTGTRPWSRVLSSYVAIHGVWFALYALAGKGFAYVGFAPVYAGELLLLLAIPALFASRRISSLLSTPLGLLSVAFLAWQALCAAPYFEAYGVNTVRDSVLWIYSGFAWVSAALILRMPGLLPTAIRHFRRFSHWFLILGPVAWLATAYLRDSLPHWSDTSVSIPQIKGDEYCVHLAAIFAFTVQGFGVYRTAWVVPVILADAILAMNVRSGLLAFVVAACFAVFLRPRPGRLLLVISAVIALVTAMAAFDLRFVPPGSAREVSIGQLVDSLESVVTNTERQDLEGTKQWRLTWWKTVWDYTVNGPYFWMGKGYGINLADSDGFQVGTRDEPLRSPHSSHITVLARSGVPGFLLWIALQSTWAFLMLRAYMRARHLRAGPWAGVFAWLITYWLAFMTAAGFDVFLEGPMAGIPFWTVFGLGWGSYTLFQSQLGVRPQQISQETVINCARF